MGTPHQEVAISLAHNQVENLSISSKRGYCYQIWAVKATLWKKLIGHFSTRGRTSFSFDHVKLINLYISSYSEAIGAMLIHANAYIVIDFLLQIFCDNQIQQILQEKQMLSWCFI